MFVEKNVYSTKDGATFHSVSLPESLQFLSTWPLEKLTSPEKTLRMSKPKLPFVLLMAVDSLLLDDSVSKDEGS